MSETEFADRLSDLIEEARKSLDDEAITAEVELRLYALREDLSRLPSEIE